MLFKINNYINKKKIYIIFYIKNIKYNNIKKYNLLILNFVNIKL